MSHVRTVQFDIRTVQFDIWTLMSVLLYLGSHFMPENHRCVKKHLKWASGGHYCLVESHLSTLVQLYLYFSRICRIRIQI